MHLVSRNKEAMYGFIVSVAEQSHFLILREVAVDQLAALRAFVRVVEAGTFTRAATTLGMPKATLTKLIQSLESHVRTKLLHRTTRRVTVTPDGAAYYERVVRLLADLDELDGAMTS
jgi:LysR family transcriptional regulator for bpeEF and oprC